MQPQPVQPPLPQTRPAKPAEPRRRFFAFASLIALIAFGGWALMQLLSPGTQTGGPGGPVATTRTITVQNGSLERTLRLTGVTTAERFVSLVVPQLRGGRGGGTTVAVSSGGRGTSVSITSTGGGESGGNRGGSTGSSGSTASATSMSASAGGGTGAGTGMSGGGSSASGLNNFRGSSNRFTGSAAARTPSTASYASRPSATGGASSPASGSISGTGGGGGGGGGGGRLSGGASDFMQVLQSVAKPGLLVRKGDFIAEFDRQYQLLRLDDFRSDVEQQERDLVRTDSELEVTRNAHALSIEQAKAAVEKAKLDIKTIPVRSDIEAETLRLQLEEAEARLKQLQAEVAFVQTSEKSARRISQIAVDQSKVELRRAEMNVDRMVVKAPMDGMLVMMTTFRGSEMGQIQQGDQLFPGMMFAQVVDPSSMLVAASINQADVELLHIGAKARLRFDAYPGLEAPAHVVSIGAITRPGGMRANFVKEVPVFLRIDKMDPRIIPDLSVSVDVILDSAPEGVVAPLESIFYDSSGAKPGVYLKSARGFERREIELGLRNNVSALIKSGLKPGDIVAVEPPRTAEAPTSAQSGAKPGA